MNGASTLVVVDAGTSSEHTLVTLEGVSTTDLSALMGHQAGHGGSWDLAGF